MVKAIGRSVLAVLAGAIVAAAVIAVVEAISSVVCPLPPGLDLHDHEAMRQHADQLPIGAFLLVLVAWAAGTLTGAWAAGLLAGRSPVAHGLVVGVLFLIAGLLTMLMIPHPRWMWVGGIVLPLACGYAGGRLVPGPPSRPGLAAS
jgi:hypothetical protein